MRCKYYFQAQKCFEHLLLSSDAEQVRGWRLRVAPFYSCTEPNLKTS